MTVKPQPGPEIFKRQRFEQKCLIHQGGAAWRLNEEHFHGFSLWPVIRIHLRIKRLFAGAVPQTLVPDIRIRFPLKFSILRDFFHYHPARRPPVRSIVILPLASYEHLFLAQTRILHKMLNRRTRLYEYSEGEDLMVDGSIAIVSGTRPVSYLSIGAAAGAVLTALQTKQGCARRSGSFCLSFPEIGCINTNIPADTCFNSLDRIDSGKRVKWQIRLTKTSSMP